MSSNEGIRMESIYLVDSVSDDQGSACTLQSSNSW